MITGPQCTAARGLLGWSMDDLAKASGLARTTINSFETGARPPTADTVTKITEALERAGIEFTRTGVQTAPPVYGFSGENWFIDLMADVRQALGPGDELLAENVDDRKSTPATRAAIDALLAAGIRLRMTASDDNPVMAFDPSWYRHIPAHYFRNWVVLIYADKVAFSTHNDTACTIIRDTNLADAMRNRFNLLWDVMEK